MIYKYKNAPKRSVGDNMMITDLYAEKKKAMDFVIGKLDGFHGTFINEKNTKYYYILNGKATVTINDKKAEVEEGDFIEIPINAKHSIEGKVKFAIMCTPPFDIHSEKII